MTDYDSREEIYRRQDRERELEQVSKAYTEYNTPNTITMRVNASCNHCEAIQSLTNFVLANKDKWGDDEQVFRQLSWAIDKTKEFLKSAEDTFIGNSPKECQQDPHVVDFRYWTTNDLHDTHDRHAC